MAHWEYVAAAVSGGLGIWRYGPRAFLMLVGGLTKNPQRSKQCGKMIALSRGDAKEILTLLADSPEQGGSPPPMAGQVATEMGSQVALEAASDASTIPASS